MASVFEAAAVSPASRARLIELDRRYRWFEAMLPRCTDLSASVRVLQQMTDVGAEMTAILLGEEYEPPEADLPMCKRRPQEKGRRRIGDDIQGN